MRREIAPVFSRDETDRPRPCEGCGYDLRGLPLDGVCPECGLPKSVPVSAKVCESLSLMPIEIVKHFRSACVVSSVVVFAALFLAMFSAAGGIQPMTHAILELALATAWCGSVVMLTPALAPREATSRGFVEGGRLRAASRWLQGGWFIAGFCAIVIAVLPAAGIVPVELFKLLRGLGIAAGLAGVWCLAILLGNLAEWTYDDFAERLFNLSLWGIPVGTPPLLFINAGWLLGLSYPALMMRGPAAVAIILLALLWLTALLAFPLALLSLTASVARSVLHNREYQARRRRQLERVLEYDQRISEAVEKMDASDRPR